MLSTVSRAPVSIALAISCAGLVEPLTEIRSGRTPAASAISSSACPNTSQPAPSSLRMRRRAIEGFAFSETSTRVSPYRQAAASACRHARTFDRSAPSDIT